MQRSQPDYGAETLQIALGIVTYNNQHYQLEQLLSSIALCARELGDKVALKCLVVDNGADSSDLFEHKKYPDFSIQHLTSQGNVGFGAGMNRLMDVAFRELNCHHFICVNPDGVFHRKAILRMLHMQNSFASCLLEAKQFPEEHPKQYDPENFDSPWLSGACLMIPAEIYKSIGGFDDRFFMYMEDVDLSWRARCAGFKTKICTDAYFGHQVLGRDFSARTEKTIFISARALAAKWHEEPFRLWCEEQLTERKLVEKVEAIPALLNNFELPSNAKSVVDFEHYFTFSQARWE